LSEKTKTLDLIMNIKTLALSTAAVLGLASAPSAQAILFTASSANLSASANFVVNAAANTLTITLANTSLTDALNPSDVLSGVYFNINGGPALTPVSALLAAGSVVIQENTPPAGGNVGGEWAYLSGLTGFGGATRGISSSGMDDVFGNANFNGPDLSSPNAVNGMNYGIVPASQADGDGNGGMDGEDGFIRNSVVFVLSYNGADFSESAIGNVSFQYGTSQTQPNIPGRPPGDTVPDGGATVALLGLGLVALGASRRLIKG
jgi:hypothetical protein